MYKTPNFLLGMSFVGCFFRQYCSSGSELGGLYRGKPLRAEDQHVRRNGQPHVCLVLASIVGQGVSLKACCFSKLLALLGSFFLFSNKGQCGEGGCTREERESEVRELRAVTGYHEKPQELGK